MPAGWSWWFGHMLVLDQKLKSLPPDVNVFTAMNDFVQDHADAEVFVLDLWPVYQPMLMISGPEVAAQASSKNELPKPADQEASFRPVIGGPSLISMNKEQWKFWRSLLNPGFSASHMLSLVPSIVDAMDIFCELLEEKVGSGVFSLDDMATRLTMDVIVKTSLDMDLDGQQQDHKLAHALRTILHWHSFWDPRILLNPLRIPVQWYYSNIMAISIDREIQKRFNEMKAARISGDAALDRKQRVKSVAALVLEEYVARKHDADKQLVETMKLDRSFSRIAAQQIRLFLWAGNDTTATAIVYTFHMLSQHPSVHAKMREEHDTIFGREFDAGDALRSNPALLNSCRYTSAVIKETLRIYPTASSIRDGAPNISLVDQKGTRIPTAGLGATVMHNYIHTNPRIWPRPLEFLPERWLVEPGHELHPPPGGFRPFEQGPRNCIGQTLVLNEMHVALILTVRKFNIVPAYNEWDAARLANEGWYDKMLRQVGLGGNEHKTAAGERAYQTSRSGFHPADGYPCRVTFART
ncbi:hypothetical protein G6011_03929 [Alternaria panax]|uniref:Uncharacterized protein n=1 Tax=Alternaria panax TaxID=48097 RepID=A0AAD4IG36_9PLEO|nr:hypothetical protein G6011_03929 [Alternaria panax]